MIDRISDEFSFYQKALSLRQQRQEVLAANIANADTPNYKSRDFNFSDALRDAMQGTGNRLPDVNLSLTAERHIPARAQGPATAELLYRQPLQPSLDGNTVDMNTERVQFADNTMRYQADLTLISQRLKSLTNAIQQ